MADPDDEKAGPQIEPDTPDDDELSGRDRSTEFEPTESGKSTSDTQAERNREDEPAG